MAQEGWLEKKARNFLVGSQKRFFKVMAQGTYLAYFSSKPKYGETNIPNGVFSIKEMTDIDKGKTKQQ